MKTLLTEDLLRTLRGVRWRLAACEAVTAFVNGALIAGGILVGLAAVERWGRGGVPVDGRLVAGALGVVLAGAALAAMRHRKTIAEAAEVIDRLGETRDRFATAFAFAGKAEATEAEAAAVQECVAHLRGKDFLQLVRVRLPREGAWLLVPLTALALLWWDARADRGAREMETAAAKAAVEDTARALEKLARQTEKAAGLNDLEHLQKMAVELKRAAAQLRAQAAPGMDTASAALRELSALEALVQQMQKPPGALSAEEAKALAAALAESGEGKAAEAVSAGDLAKAAEELEKAARALADKKEGDRAGEELAKALQKLAEKAGVSEALRKLAQAAGRPAPNGSGAGGEARRRLAEALQQMNGGQAGPGSGENPKDASALKNLLAALQAMKQGEGAPSGNSAPGNGSPGVVMQSFAPAGPASQPPGGDSQIPGGQAGSERDPGTTDSPFGAKAAEPASDPRAQQLAGQLGEGETLQQMVPAAGDRSNSGRRYRELYEALAPAAQESVVQENIPLGSRFFIKRYFESIRPKE